MSTVERYRELLLAEADAADAFADEVLETAKLANAPIGIAKDVMRTRDAAERLRLYAEAAPEQEWVALLTDDRLAAFVQVLRDDAVMGESLRLQFAAAVLLEREQGGA